MTRSSVVPELRIERLAPHHDRAGFRCGVPALDIYLQRQARQDVDRNLAAAFVLIPDGITIAGFFTLSAYSILAADLPEAAAKKLPRFPLPVTLLGRMGLAENLQGQGLGSILLIKALERAFAGSKHIAAWAVIVDAKQGAREFYRKHDFIPLPSQPDRMFLPMTTIGRLIEESK